MWWKFSMHLFIWDIQKNSIIYSSRCSFRIKFNFTKLQCDLIYSILYFGVISKTYLKSQYTYALICLLYLHVLHDYIRKTTQTYIEIAAFFHNELKFVSETIYFSFHSFIIYLSIYLFSILYWMHIELKPLTRILVSINSTVRKSDEKLPFRESIILEYDVFDCSPW